MPRVIAYTRDNIGKKKGSNTGATHETKEHARRGWDVMRMNLVEFGWQEDPSTPCKQCAKERREAQTSALRDDKSVQTHLPFGLNFRPGGSVDGLF
jgi:hypothetical protein